MTRPIVFISYSRKDEAEKNRLLSHLGVLQSAGLINTWSDDLIGAGDDWQQEIDKSMAEARVAILLVTAHFLTSEFILATEMPSLLRRRHDEGLIVFPVIAKACAWRTIPWLRQMRIRPKDGRPIWRDEGRYVDEDLAAIAEEVAAMIQRPVGGDSVNASGSARRPLFTLNTSDSVRFNKTGPWRILVVDDEPNWQKRLKRILKEVNCSVVVASDYEEAGEQLDQPAHFDLATIDLNLDKSTEYADGLELVSRIRQTFGPDFPIVVITGQGDLSRQRRAFKDYGVVDFIEKARFDFEEFKDIVIEAISNAEV